MEVQWSNLRILRFATAFYDNLNGIKEELAVAVDGFAQANSRSTTGTSPRRIRIQHLAFIIVLRYVLATFTPTLQNWLLLSNKAE